MMLNRLRQRISDAIAPRTRSLEAAGGRRRWDGENRHIGTRTIHAAQSLVRQRATYHVLNDPVGARTFEAQKADLVGDGIRYRCTHPSPAVCELFQRDMVIFGDDIDAEGQVDLFGLQAVVAGDLCVNGEALLAWETSHDGTQQLRRLNPEQMATDITRHTDGGGTVRMGVEFDRTNRIVAYHIRPHAHSDPFEVTSVKAVRMPASEIIHVFRPLLPGMVRGLSWFAPVLLSAADLNKLTDAILQRSLVSALHTAFITSESGGVPYEGDSTGNAMEVSMEPGAAVLLDPGQSVEFANLPDQGGAAELMKTVLRQIAVGSGVTYESATGDYSEINFSSSRAAKLEHRRFISAVQRHTLIFQFCRPVARRFVRWQVLRGRVSARDFMADPRTFEASKWLPPAWAAVDPLKEARAAQIELENNLRSRSDLISERGMDAEEVDAEIAADAARLTRLGITGTEAQQ